LLVHVICILD